MVHQEQHTPPQASQQNEIIIQHAPVMDARRSTAFYLLTLHTPERTSQQCTRGLLGMTHSLAQIQRRLLIQFAGVESMKEGRPRSLPHNVEVLDPGALTPDGFWYHGRKLSSWWEYAHAYEAPRKKELAPTEGTVIRVLNLIRRNENLGIISHTVKQDPGLLHGLLRYINSAKVAFNNVYGGFRSIEQIIMYMGYREFAKWLSLYLLHSSVEGKMPVLYLASIVRAQIMEILAKPAGFPQKQHDEIFITGIFSLLDEITGVPMEVILLSLELDDAIKEALLEQKGQYAPLLKLACASENGTLEELSALRTELGVSASETNLAVLKGIQFATDFD